MDPDYSSATSRSKRPRTSCACENCRQRKIRCDGARPRCEACVSRGPNAVCVYEASASAWDQDREKYIDQLENRVSFLEKSAKLDWTPQAQGKRHSEPIASQPRGTKRSISAATPEFGAASEPVSTTSRTPIEPSSRNLRQRSTPEFSNSLSHGDVQQNNPRSSSWGSFAQLVEAASNYENEANNDNKSKPPEETYIQDLSPIFDLSTWPPQNENFNLPTRRQAEDLLDNYWQNIFPHLPLLDTEKFKASYEELWSGRRESNPKDTMFRCLVNMVFALSSQTSRSISNSQRHQSSLSYFNRARNLLHFDHFEGASLQMVQTLLVASQYLLSTDDPHLCWIALGAATRVALSQNLHQEALSERTPDPVQRELVRRVWYCCVDSDRLLAMILGRTPRIAQSLVESVPMPQIRNIAHRPSANQPRSRASDISASFGLFVMSARLTTILDSILDIIYDQGEHMPSRILGDFNLDKVMQLDDRLGKWHESLPDPLNAPPNGFRQGESVFAGQANVLRQRYLHVRILLYRPCLANFVSSTNSSSKQGHQQLFSLHDGVIKQCSLLCVRSATAVIDLVFQHQTTDGSNGVLSPWWFNVLYVHSAAIVIAAALLNRSLSLDLGFEPLSNYLSKACTILQRYSSFCEPAQRCLGTLNRLKERSVKESPLLTRRDREPQHTPQPQPQQQIQQQQQQIQQDDVTRQAAQSQPLQRQQSRTQRSGNSHMSTPVPQLQTISPANTISPTSTAPSQGSFVPPNTASSTTSMSLMNASIPSYANTPTNSNPVVTAAMLQSLPSTTQGLAITIPQQHGNNMPNVQLPQSSVTNPGSAAPGSGFDEHYLNDTSWFDDLPFDFTSFPLPSNAAAGAGMNFSAV